MAYAKDHEKLFSDEATGRLGLPRCYGEGQYGFSKYGDKDLFLIREGYGVAVYGNSEYGDVEKVNGVYRIAYDYGKRYNERVRNKVAPNPRTIPQQENRQKFKEAVAAWYDLTDEQRALYNKEAKFRRLNGWNLFIKTTLLSSA